MAPVSGEGGGVWGCVCVQELGSCGRGERRTGEKRGLFQKKPAITEILIAFGSQIFIIHSPTFVLSINPTTESLFSSTSLLSICCRKNIPM